MGYTTRIDRALRQAQKEFFTAANGGRKNIPKIIILLTDGTQSEDDDAEDPAKIAKELRGAGMSTIVVGIGSGEELFLTNTNFIKNINRRYSKRQKKL